jgi:2,5-diketo-D-gluconate reductase A
VSHGSATAVVAKQDAHQVVRPRTLGAATATFVRWRAVTGPGITHPRIDQHDEVSIAADAAGPTTMFHPPDQGQPIRMSTSTGQVPTIPLPGGAHIPQLGFGVWQVPPQETVEPVTQALLAGYRHIDTASVYGNEAGVGQAVHAAGLQRDDVFITTKCFNDDHGHEQAKRALKTSLQQLEMDHVDLYLIHWPVPAHDKYVETWQAFIELQAEGLARSIGVSNFQPAHLERLIAETGVTPALNQVELHPQFQQAALRRAHDELGIRTEAWSPLGKGRVFHDPAVAAIAQAHGRTPAQVVIRWHLQLGNIVIPKSVTPGRIEQNLDVFGFHLSGDEMAAFEGLEAGHRTGPDPDVFVRPSS